MTPKDKTALLGAIRQYDFAVVEANLFLDTHPCDREAIAYYNKYNCLLQEATAAYEKHYGPLTVRGGTGDDRWSWVEGPWPWEYSANASR